MGGPRTDLAASSGAVVFLSRAGRCGRERGFLVIAHVRRTGPHTLRNRPFGPRLARFVQDSKQVPPRSRAEGARGRSGGETIARSRDWSRKN